MGERKRREWWKLANENEEERGENEEKRRRERRERNVVKRRCEGFVSVEAFEILCQERDLESCGDLSWKDFLDETEDLSDRESAVSPSSVVTEFCDGFSCCSDWDFVEPQSFSFSKKRAHSCTVTQEEIRFEEPQGKAPLFSRRRMRPPAPLQNSYSSFEEEQGNFEVVRPDVECERQNDHSKDKAVPGRK